MGVWYNAELIGCSHTGETQPSLPRICGALIRNLVRQLDSVALNQDPR